MNNSFKRMYLRVINNLSNWVLVIFTILNFLVFYNVFAHPDLQVKCKNELFIGQVLGNIQFYQSIYIKNIGDESGFISKIHGFIRSKDRDAIRFRRKITANLFNGSGIPFIEIGLGPNENFNSEFTLYKEPDRITRDSAALIETLVMNEYEIASKKNPYLNVQSYNISSNLSKIIENFSRTRINELLQGEYEYIIQIKTNKDKEVFCMCYSFFIYPDNITTFNERTKDYKKYSNRFSDRPRPTLNIPLTQIQNPEIIESLRRELEN